MGLFVGCAGATPTITDQLRIADPRGDDHGPGAYAYPQGEVLRPGALDLREVRLYRDADEVVVEVAFHGPVTVARGVRLAREQQDDLFVATVDLYLDLIEGAGRRAALPGRGVRLPEGLGWDLAIVLSPIPSRLRDALDGHPGAQDVQVPNRVRVRGETLRARVPASLFAGHALSDLGVAAAVTGTVFGSTFKTEVEGLVPTAFVREVTTRPGRCDRWEEQMDGAPCTFGGCKACEGHPRVLDALHPEPGAQEAALSQWDGRLGQVALLPMVWGDGIARGAAPERAFVVAQVIDRRGALLTILAPAAQLPEPGAFVDGLDASGSRVATLVLRKRLDGGDRPMALLEVVDGDAEAVASARWR